MDQIKFKKLDEPFYTAEQIVVPPDLPEVLKQFTKAAIKTQPPDLLEWSASYFRARATNTKLPVKDRLEIVPDDYDDLTLGLLKILHRELGHRNVVDLAEIHEHWVGLGLAPAKFNDITSVGQLPATVEWQRFVVVACAKLSQKMEDIFKNFCLVLTNEPDGNNPMIPFNQFKDAYQFIAFNIEGVNEGIQEKFITYLAGVAGKQNGKISPADFTYRDCPPMNKYTGASGPAGSATTLPREPVLLPRKSQEATKRPSQDAAKKQLLDLAKRHSALPPVPVVPPTGTDHSQSDAVSTDSAATWDNETVSTDG